MQVQWSRLSSGPQLEELPDAREATWRRLHLGFRALLFPEVMLSYRQVDRMWLGLWVPSDGMHRRRSPLHDDLLACVQVHGKGCCKSQAAAQGPRLTVGMSTRGGQSSSNCA